MSRASIVPAAGMNAGSILSLAFAILFAASFASAARFDLVFNARSTGVIDFSTGTGRDCGW